MITIVKTPGSQMGSDLKGRVVVEKKIHVTM